ncbi:hypothetical protein UNH65_18065 [Chitinophaga sp. 180180018-2]|nr:hypothetical protein [Chitinophaga sp. 212800010-3]
MFLGLISLLFSSCNYALFVPKSNIFHVRTGYLIYFNNREYFSPEKKIKQNDFFSKRARKNGYLLSMSEWGNDFSTISQKYIIENYCAVKDTSILMEDSIKIIPVEVGSMPAHFKSKVGTADWQLKYNGRDFLLKYANTNNEYVWTLYPILDSDKSRIKD